MSPYANLKVAHGVNLSGESENGESFFCHSVATCITSAEAASDSALF